MVLLFLVTRNAAKISRFIGEVKGELRKAKDIALSEMQEAASQMGANAVIAVDLDYETVGIGNGGNMLMVSASGTAVRLS